MVRRHALISTSSDPATDPLVLPPSARSSRLGLQSSGDGPWAFVDNKELGILRPTCFSDSEEVTDDTNTTAPKANLTRVSEADRQRKVVVRRATSLKS